MKAIMFMLLPAMLFGLTSNQKVTMKRVREIAKKYTKYSVTVSAVAGTETSWGMYIIGDLNRQVKKASFGTMQITIPTARWIINKDYRLKNLRGISDTLLITKLLSDIETSVKIAAIIIDDNIKRYGYKNGVRRYNGYWKVDKNGKALRDKNGRKVPNKDYVSRVEKNKIIVLNNRGNK